MQPGPQQADRSMKQVAAIQSVLHGQSPTRGTILKVSTYCTVYVLNPTKAMAQAAVLKPDTNPPGYSITQANVASLVLLVVWRGDDGKVRTMLFSGDAPWSCVRDGTEYFQTITLAGADSSTKKAEYFQTATLAGADSATTKAIKEVFGAKGSKVDVNLMTVPHHGSTNNMDVNGNYPVNATNIIVCSGDGGINLLPRWHAGRGPVPFARVVQHVGAIARDGAGRARAWAWALGHESACNVLPRSTPTLCRCRKRLSSWKRKAT
jgi:hypothetical protein